MLRKRKTAVRPTRNIVGKPLKGIIGIRELFGRSNEDLQNLLNMGYDFQVAGGTTPTNTVLANPIYLPRGVVVSTDQTINQGDLVWWDATNYTLKPITNATQVAVGASGGLIGAAQGTDNPNVYPAPAAGVPSENLPGIVVQRGGSVRMNSTTGDGSYFPFEPVTIGADAQTITRGGETTANRVGFIMVPAPVSARGAPGATPLPETVAGGQGVELWLEVKFPDTALL